MAFPTQAEIEIPLLQALEVAGGEAEPGELYGPLADRFPAITSVERQERHEVSGLPKWPNRVQWARQRLVGKGEIDGSQRGVWKITDAGRARVARAATDGEPVPPDSKTGLAAETGLTTACESIGPYTTWGEAGSTWVPRVAETLQWVRDADQATRATLDFQRRLWDDNPIAAVGQGNIPIDKALQDAEFRQWFAAESMRPLPPSREERVLFLEALYQGLKDRLSALRGKTPHLKIFRIIAALYPQAMTTVASPGALHALARALGAPSDLDKAGRHVWVRHRVDEVLGPPADGDLALAERMALPWLIYERYVQKRQIETTQTTAVEGDTRLLPLPAARRRRGLTPIKGLFPGTLSVLEFVQQGVTREELIDFLKASSPDAKATSLGVSINAYQSELDVIKRDGDQYVLTERGINVLESQDPNLLADWLLTRILGVDRAIVELRDRAPLKPQELNKAIRAMNPTWASDFVPQAITSWLRSMDVIRTTDAWLYELTETGQQWAALIHWQPEVLKEPSISEAPGDGPGPADSEVTFPPLTEIIRHIQSTGHFAPEQIARLHAGLWCHPRRHFAILTGLSGSGKTKLAREYARALAPAGKEARLLTLPVQPGWYDPGALLGFQNPLRSEAYARTPFLEFLIAASGDPEVPYVAVLDEMNLSHPEQYMAPLLSAMETDEAIPLHTEGAILDGVPEKLAYPNNLVLIGTVNMDETTHGLSDKVLDRAFVLEFWNVDLAAYPRWGQGELDAEHERRVREALEGLMAALEPARLHFGWRVVDDVFEFMKHVDEALLPLDVALDSVVYAKVLPKLRGEDGPRLREALSRCEETLRGFGLEASRKKVAELRHDLATTGSARFWR